MIILNFTLYSELIYYSSYNIKGSQDVLGQNLEYAEENFSSVCSFKNFD